MKLLLVDDDEFLRDMYATKFSERGDEISVASDATQALVKLEKETFDVALLDMVLPTMTGIELLEKVFLISPHTHCVMLSNLSDSEQKENALKAGAIGYIVKADMVPSEVVESVHNIIGEVTKK